MCFMENHLLIEGDTNSAELIKIKKLISGENASISTLFYNSHNVIAGSCEDTRKKEGLSSGFQKNPRSSIKLFI